MEVCDAMYYIPPSTKSNTRITVLFSNLVFHSLCGFNIVYGILSRGFLVSYSIDIIRESCGISYFSEAGSVDWLTVVFLTEV